MTYYVFGGKLNLALSISISDKQHTSMSWGRTRSKAKDDIPSFAEFRYLIIWKLSAVAFSVPNIHRQTGFVQILEKYGKSWNLM